MKETLKEQLQKQFAKVEQTIIAAIKNGEQVKKWSDGMYEVGGLTIFSLSNSEPHFSVYLHSEELTRRFGTQVDELQRKRDKLMGELKEVDNKLNELTAKEVLQ